MQTALAAPPWAARRRARLTALALVAAVAVVLAASPACVRFPGPRGPGPAVLRTQPAPSERETYCAWYGDAHDGVLYYGLSAFWWAYRQHGGDPAADLLEPGPQLVGRFDLRRRALLPPLDVTAPGARSGVWDVLAHPDGALFYTTFFEAAGRVDLASGAAERLEAAGRGLNELAPGPEGSVLATRYGGAEGADGSVVVLGADGRVRAEHVLDPVPGFQVAPKTVAWDPVRREIWVNTDLVPRGSGGAVRHDLRILGEDGRERLRTREPELQFVAFRPDGHGVAAEVDAEGLWLRILAPEDAGPAATRGERFLADADFERAADFVQDVQFEAPDGRAVVMRWSGRLHVVDPEIPLARTRSLPRPAGGLYYTGVLDDGRVCATLCREAQVVCRDGMGL